MAPPAVTPFTLVMSSYTPSDKKGQKFAYRKKVIIRDIEIRMENKIIGLKIGDLKERFDSNKAL